MLQDLDRRTDELKERVKFCEETERQLEFDKQNAQSVADECQRQFDEAIPMLKKAVTKMKKLSKSDMTELKSIKRPPPAVLALMKCVCILMAAEVKKTRGPDGVDYDDWWAATISPKVLGNMRILDTLAGFDPERLSPELMLKLKHAQEDAEEFSLANI